MAQTWNSRRLRHEREMDDRLIGELNTMAKAVGAIVLRFSVPNPDGGERIVPNNSRTREALRRAIWVEVVKPYFIGQGVDPLVGTLAQSPYTRLMVDEGILGAIAIQAERQVSIVEKYAASDPVVLQWLTGSRPVGLREMTTLQKIFREQGDPKKPKFIYDPFHLFVDPNGYRLSDRVWRVAIEERRNIDRLLEYHIPLGTSAVDIAKELEQYLTPGGAKPRTRRPYGVEGSYGARRLSRTEITAAAGRATVNASVANPWVDGLGWRLSNNHKDADPCDDFANGGENGDGNYDFADFPSYPDHPHEMCTVVPVVVKNPADVTRELRTMIDEQAPEAELLRGAFNEDWLIQALFSGEFQRQILETGIGLISVG